MRSRVARNTVCGLLFLVVCTPLSARTRVQKSDNELVFGILPFLSPVVLIKRFAPLKDYLQHVTGKTIYLESAPNFSEFLKRTTNHQYDIIFTAPHFVPVTLEDDHYQLMAASNKLAAHIMVKSGSRLTDLRQLAGKRVALGPNQAFVVMIAKNYLKIRGLKGQNSPLYSNYKSHNAALRALEFDDVDAAVIGSYLLAAAKAKGYRQLGETRYYPGAVFIVSSDLPKAIRSKLRAAFISIRDSKEGRKTLKLIKFPGFQTTREQEYESLKSLARDATKSHLVKSDESNSGK